VPIAGVLTMLAGTWLVLAPPALDYPAAGAHVNDVFCGGAVALVGALRLAVGAAWRALGHLAAFIGLWLLVSAFWLVDSAAAAWNDAIAGTTITALGIVLGMETDSVT
jgi:hypothetical protein